MEEVFITRYAGYTPIGNSVEDMLRHFRSGEVGLVPWDCGHKGQHSYGFVDFDWEAERVRVREIDRRVESTLNECDLLGLCAVEKLLDGISIRDLDASRISLVASISSATGMMKDWNDWTAGHDKVDRLWCNKFMPSSPSASMGRYFGFQGPTCSLSAACTGSGHVMLMAWMMLQLGIIDAAVVLTQSVMGGREEGQLYAHSLEKLGGTRTGSIKFASPDRDGYTIGDVGAAILLENRKHMDKRGAKPIVQILHVSASNDGVDIFAPSGEGLARLYAEAKKIAPDVDYINPHGAGTKTGDPVEIGVIRDFYGDKPYVNSTKAYTGHTMEGAFLQELVHAVVQTEHGLIAKTPFTTEIAEDCKGINLVLGRSIETRIHRFISHNLGLGGVNCLTIAERCYP